MPISDEALQKETNRFIAVKGEARVGQAIAAFKALAAQPWWHLVVSMPDGSWAVIRFRDLPAKLDDPSAADLYVRDLKNLTAVAAVERDSIETKAAQAQARKSPARVLVVTANGTPVGILVEGARRSAGGMALTAPDVNNLGGKYINLKDYGTILLSSSKK
ncbi:MAG TPA: hypothetical protein VIU65_11085 [Pyrinomonadaceae bacterium]